MREPLSTQACCTSQGVFSGLAEGEVVPVVSVVAEHTPKFPSKIHLLNKIVSVTRLLGATGVRGIKQNHSIMFTTQVLLHGTPGLKHAEQLTVSFTGGYSASSTSGTLPISQHRLHEVGLLPLELGFVSVICHFRSHRSASIFQGWLPNSSFGNFNCQETFLFTDYCLNYWLLVSLSLHSGLHVIWQGVLVAQLWLAR